MKLRIDFNGFEQRLIFAGKPFVAKIFEPQILDGLPSGGFNTIRVVLDLTERSLLRWERDLELAEKAIQEGFLILWDLDLALMDDSLEDESRFMTLQLNVDYFNKTVLKRFSEHTLGVALFHGDLLMPPHAMDYLKSLAALLDDETACFLFFDAGSEEENLVHYFQTVNQETFGFFLPIVKGKLAEDHLYAFPALGWGFGTPLGFCSQSLHEIPSEQRVCNAVCLPKECNEVITLAAITSFGKKPLRIIPENLLTQEWDGIDYLTVFQGHHPDYVRRQFNGFIAAGGEIIEYQDVVASPPLQEISQPFSLASSR